MPSTWGSSALRAMDAMRARQTMDARHAMHEGGLSMAREIMMRHPRGRVKRGFYGYSWTSCFFGGLPA
ncbi:MAG: hypothetical protein IKT16_11095, partial [Desulfovibrio sp.]|nr:hypothetical protein [Desulfovibrio sp.]